MRNLKVFVILLLIHVTISAQKLKLEIWKNYTNINDVRKVAVVDNIIWAATSGGLYKYDLSTKSFTAYTKSEGLSSQDLTALTIDKNGQIWIGSGEGYINVLNPAQGTVQKIYDIYNSSKTQKGINDLFISGDTLFVSHDFGLSLLNTSTSSFMDNVTKFGSLQIESKVLSVSRSSLIYACLSTGLAIQIAGKTNLFSPDSWNSYSYSSLQLNKAVQFKNELFIATGNGLYKFSDGNFTLFDLAGENVIDLSVKGSYLYVLTKAKLYKFSTAMENIYTSDGTVQVLSGLAVTDEFAFASSNKGISQISSSGTSRISANCPITNTFMNVDLDDSGNLWAGTGKDSYGKGVMFFNGSTWTNYYDENAAAPANDFHNVYVGSTGMVYWMNWGQGFTTFSNNVTTVYNTTNTPMVGISGATSFLVVSDIKSDTKGNTWFLNLWPSDRNVLTSLSSDNKWQSFNFPTISASQIFYKMVIDKYSTKWITVSANMDAGDKGIFAFNESSTNPIYKFYSTADKLNSDVINSLTIDLRGYIWIGTGSGINYIADPEIPTISTPYNPGIKYQYVTCIEVDALDQKWVGTKAGLFILSADCMTQIAHYSVSDSPLPSNEITSLVVDKKNGIAYIGTDYGLSVLKTDLVEPQESFTELVTYPNPFIVADGKGTSLKIDGLVKESSVKILSLTGQLISEFVTSGGRIGFWDGKDKNGNYVSSGVYYLIAYDQEGNNVAKGKFAVIKK
jgi:ligand-binding sensor domain-containing protein